MIICSECPERFCPSCYTKCPEMNRHRANHAYTIKKFYLLREGELFTITLPISSIGCSGYNYEYEEKLLQRVEHAGSMKSHYQELYVDGPIGRLTRETSDYEVVDHTALLEDPGECNASSVTPEKQIELGLLPLRNDFAPEVNDGAERILVDRPENLEPEVETLVGEMFHRQFKERHRKRKLVQEYGLVDR